MKKVIEMFKNVAKYVSMNVTEMQNFKIIFFNTHSSNLQFNLNLNKLIVYL